MCMCFLISLGPWVLNWLTKSAHFFKLYPLCEADEREDSCINVFMFFYHMGKKTSGLILSYGY